MFNIGAAVFHRLGVTTVFALLFHSAALATGAPGSLQDCLALSSALNKDFPERTNKWTWVMSTTCYPGKKRVVLAYTMRITYSKKEAPPGMRLWDEQAQLNGWCSNPGMRQMINLADIKYVYYDVNGVYIGEAYHSKEECSR